MVVGLWPGDKADETRAHMFCGGRGDYYCSNSEVFQFFHPWEDLEGLHKLMAKGTTS
jgi:hypothetical protein